MRGYPIGGFLFWRVSDETVRSHAFYGFIREYDQRSPNNVCPRLREIVPSDNRFAILDGQQRLTSLNVGLRGSHTVKLPNKRGRIQTHSRSVTSTSTCARKGQIRRSRARGGDGGD